MRGIPVVEVLRPSTNEISGDEDIEDGGDERDLLLERHRLRVGPSPVDPVHTVSHSPLVLV